MKIEEQKNTIEEMCKKLGRIETIREALAWYAEHQMDDENVFRTEAHKFFTSLEQSAH